MNVTIKYFGSLADISQLKEEQLSFEEDTISVAALKSKIESNYQNMESANYLIAVNQKMSDLQTSINDKDVIAFLPPFAGG